MFTGFWMLQLGSFLDGDRLDIDVRNVSYVKCYSVEVETAEKAGL